MKIRLNVYRNGETVNIYVMANESEPPFELNESKTSIVKFHHTPLYEALQNEGSNPRNYDEDYFVEFDSRMPFAAFCKILYESNFNNPNNYNRWTHNCAHAAAFALKQIPEIDLKLPGTFELNHMNESSLIFLPGFVLTPYTLFLAAKKSKIESRQQQKTYADIKRTICSLNKNKKNTNSQIRHGVDNIISEMQHRLTETPHHADFYLIALQQTNQMLIQAIEGCQKAGNLSPWSYKYDATLFYTRTPGKNKNLIEESLVLSILTGLIINSLKTYLLGSPTTVLEYFKHNLIFSPVAVATLVGVSIYSSNKNTEEMRRVKNTRETSLSKSMFDLSDQCCEAQHKLRKR